MPTLRFRDTAVEAEAGADVLSQLLKAGADMRFLCMGGSCGTCKVRIISGHEHLTPPAFGEQLRGCVGGERLSCQAMTIGTGDVVVDQ
jgi:ferredoxin